MIALIDLYQKELLKVNGFAPSTVETYTINIRAFCHFAKNELKTDLTGIDGLQLLKWILYLKSTGVGHSRIESHHHALRSFFAFVEKTGAIRANPAQALPSLIVRRRQRTKPISTAEALKLLGTFDQDTWTGLRDYTMVSILWALGLRTSELTRLRVRDFETGYGKRIGLLRVRGKNKKQRALFITDRLFDQVLSYLSHPKSPKRKLAALFPADTKITAISNSRVQRIVKDQAREAGIAASVTPRVLRHCFASEMYHQNVPLPAIQDMMGHDSVADTAIYIHVSDGLKQQALDSIHISARHPWQ